MRGSRVTTANRPFFMAVIGAIAADIATKAVAVQALRGSMVDLGFIELRLVRNEGIAFGLAGAIPPAALIVGTSLVVAALVVAVWKGVIPAGVPAGLVVGGAVANIIDRFMGGSVIDMLDLGWWPAFNLADVFIVVGFGAVALQSARSPESFPQEPV